MRVLPARCPHRYAWNPTWECERRGWLRGRCEHALDRLRWRWTSRRWRLALDLSNVHRPYLLVDEDRPIQWVTLSYGHPNGDPTCSITFTRKAAA